jgi:hypothetical protein
MALRDDFMQDWSAAADSIAKRAAALNRGLDTLESHGVDVTLQRSLLAVSPVDRFRAQFDASRWIGRGLADLDAGDALITTASGVVAEP